jgi:hypothetical protein
LLADWVDCREEEAANFAEEHGRKRFSEKQNFEQKGKRRVRVTTWTTREKAVQAEKMSRSTGHRFGLVWLDSVSSPCLEQAVPKR